MSNYARYFVGRKRSAIAVAVSLGILMLLAYKVDARRDQIIEEISRARWSILLLTFAFSGLWHIFVGADKWWRILRSLGAPVPYREVLRVRLGSDPIRFAAPFKMGEVVNAVYFGRLEKFGFSRAAGSIAFDKALNFFGTLFWLYVGIVALADIPDVGHIVLHTVMGAAILAVISIRQLRDLARFIAGKIHPKILRLTAGILAAFEEFSFPRKVGFLLYGIVFQLRPLIVCYLLFTAFRPAQMPSIDEFLTFGSVAVLMSNIPLTVAGIGPREATIVALFAPYGGKEMLLSIGVLMSFSIHIVPAILGIPFMFGLLRALAAHAAEPIGPPHAAVPEDNVPELPAINRPMFQKEVN